MIDSYEFANMHVSAYQRAKGDNPFCGDSYTVIETDAYFVCAIADGLGSGKLAKESSEAAIKSIERNHSESVVRMLEYANNTLTGKRGAVTAVFKIDYKRMELSYCGIGNINLLIYFNNDKIIRPISLSGYLSGKPQKYRVEKIPIENAICFLMYSDGFQLNLKNNEVIFRMKSPEQAVYYIEQNLNKRTDDITYLIGKMV